MDANTQELIEKFASAAAQVGSAAWVIAVRQQYVSAWVTMAGWGSTLVMYPVAAWGVFKWCNTHLDMKECNVEPLKVALLLIGAGVVIMGLLIMWLSVGALIFPEGAALEQLTQVPCHK